MQQTITGIKQASRDWDNLYVTDANNNEHTILLDTSIQVKCQDEQEITIPAHKLFAKILEGQFVQQITLG